MVVWNDYDHQHVQEGGIPSDGSCVSGEEETENEDISSDQESEVEFQDENPDEEVEFEGEIAASFSRWCRKWSGGDRSRL